MAFRCALKELIDYMTQPDAKGIPTRAGRDETFAEVFGALNGPSANKQDTESIRSYFPSVGALLKQQLAALASSAIRKPLGVSSSH